MTDLAYVNAWRALRALPHSDQIEFVRGAAAFVAASADQPAISALGSIPQPSPKTQALVVKAQPAVPKPAIVASSALIDGSAFPLIGGPTLSLDPLNFATPAFRQRFMPGTRIIVYIAGSKGLKNLMALLKAARLSHHGYKIGTAVCDVLDERLERLSRGEYGSRWRDHNNVIRDDGFDRWSAQILDPDAAQPSPGSPLTVTLRGIELDLPSTMHPVRFDQTLGRALCGVRIDGFARSGRGERALLHAGYDRRRFIRHTPRGKSSERATELCFIRPQTDLLRLVRVIEQIILDEALGHSASCDNCSVSDLTIQADLIS